MHNEFTTNEIIANMQNKTIIINFAYDIDPNSINESTIQIKKRGCTEPSEYKANVEGRTVNVVLLKWPEPNDEYIVRVEKLKDILGNELEVAARKKVKFESSICSTVNIINPAFNELIKSLNIKWEEIKADENHELINSYLIEISSDANFYNIVNTSEVQDKNEVTLQNLSAGQYFLRIRVQKDNQYGYWSEVISFIMDNSISIDNNQNVDINDPVFIKPIQLICTPDNGETPDSFIFEFDCPIDSDFLDNIIIIRKEI